MKNLKILKIQYAVLLFLSILAVAGPGWAKGTMDYYPQGLTQLERKLAQVRIDYLMNEVKGPLKSSCVRYRDVYEGKKRSFLWAAQSYQHPNGDMSYALVLAEVTPSGLKIISSGGSTSPILGPTEAEYGPDPTFNVQNNLSEFLEETNVAGKLAP